MTQHAIAKATDITRDVTSDQNWNIQDELMCQVFGFTLYGYIFGIGRIHYMIEVEEIHAIVVDQLVSLGIGRNYAVGLVDAAHREFTTKNNQSWQNQLIGVGHSHSIKEDKAVLIASIFSNTEALRKSCQ